MSDWSGSSQQRRPQGLCMPPSKPMTVTPKCPVCESPMALRESRFGKFYGCRAYPRCRGLIAIDKAPGAGAAKRVKKAKKKQRNRHEPKPYVDPVGQVDREFRSMFAGCLDADQVLPLPPGYVTFRVVEPGDPAKVGECPF